MKKEGLVWVEPHHNHHIVKATRLSPWLLEHLEVLACQRLDGGQALLVRPRTLEGAAALATLPRCPSRGSRSEISKIKPGGWK